MDRGGGSGNSWTTGSDNNCSAHYVELYAPEELFGTTVLHDAEMPRSNAFGLLADQDF